MYRLLLLLTFFLQSIIAFSQETVHDSIVSQSLRDSVFIVIKPLDKSVYRIKIKASDSLRSLGDNKLHNMHLYNQQDPLKHIKETGFKFLLRELAMDYPRAKYTSDSITDAVNILFDYVKNDSVRRMVGYLRDYIKQKKTEEALKAVKKQIAYEKVMSYQPGLKIEKEIIEEDDVNWKAAALKRLYDYVENDPVHQWIRKVSRDSVFLGVRNYMNDSIKFWINNGKQSFKRFWLKKNRRDSIGIWIQNTNDRSVRILVDDDVYQQSVQQSKRNVIQNRLANVVSADYYKLAKLNKYKRYRKIWKTGIKTGLYFNQGYVSKNWSQGGESSIAVTSTLEAYANYKRKRHTWENRLDIKYGLLKSGDNKFRKNEDRLELNTKYGQKAVKSWYYSAQFNLKTQIANGYSYPRDKSRKLNSRFFSPANIIVSLGMDYKPNSKLSILISPLSAKYTIVADTAQVDQTVYGIDKDKKIKKEVGAYVNLFSKIKFWGDFELKNKVTLYANYAEKSENVDIDWELILNMPISQYLSTKISTHLLSDDDTSSQLQFRENFALGVSYRF